MTVEIVDRSGFNGLTAKEAEVVRLVLDCHSSKEIAKLLGITPAAVDQRLKTARLRSGNVSRRELARRYRASDEASPELPLQPETLSLEEGLQKKAEVAALNENHLPDVGPTRAPANSLQYAQAVAIGFAMGLLVAATSAIITVALLGT